MQNAQKITSVYKSAYLQNRLNSSSEHLFDKYDIRPENKTDDNEANSKNEKFFKTILKEITNRGQAPSGR